MAQRLPPLEAPAAAQAAKRSPEDAAPLVARLCWTVLVLAPALWVGWHLVDNAVDVPFWDEWQLLPLIVGRETGHVPLELLTDSHNGHRLVLPRLLMLGLASVSGWDVRWAQFASLAVGLLSVGVVALLARRTLGSAGPRLAPAVVLASALLLFGLNAWENWAWGWQVQIHLCVLFALITALGVARSRGRWRDALALAAAATAASLCFASGVVLLPLSALALLVHPSGGPPGRRIRLAMVPGLAGAAMLWLHLGERTGPPGLSPADAGALASAYLGSGFSTGDVAGAVTVGALGLLAWGGITLGLWIRRPLLRPSLLPWIVIGGFAAGSALLTGLARGSMGPGQVLVPRYVTLSSLLWIALSASSALALAPLIRGGGGLAPGRLLAVGAGLGGTVMLLGLQYVRAGAHGLEQWRHHRLRLEHGERLLRLQDPPPGSLDLLFVDGEVRRWKPAMRRLGLSLFRGDATDPPALDAPVPARRITGAIETVEPDSAFPGCVVVRGWAVDPFGEGEVEAVLLTVDGRLAARVERLSTRDDVRGGLGRPLGFRSGWEGHLAGTAGLEPGLLEAFALLADGRVVALRGARPLADPRD